MNLLDLTEITKETFEHGQKATGFLHAPDSPGFVYFLKKGDHSFCIKGQSVQNMKKTMNDTSSLRDHCLSQGYSLLFFKTPSLELANTLKEQVADRRFLINDDLLNIAASPTHWWMRKYPDGFNIRFHRFCFPEKHFFRLGPLGDPRIAGRRFNQSIAMMAKSFPLKEWKCNEKEFFVSTSDPFHLNFTLLKNIFSLGKNPTVLSHYPHTNLGRKIYHYFQKIAIVRGFWRELEERYLSLSH